MDKYLFFLHLYGYKKAPRDYPLRLFCVGLPGFEPGQTEPKPVVLPLHHSPNFLLSFEMRCKDTIFLCYLPNFLCVFLLFIN